jgi:hypothetical protein
MDKQFQDWWFNHGGYEIAEKLYGKQASLQADKIDPKKESINVYSDILEKLAWENKLHLK